MVLRIGLIGAGTMGTNHARVLSAMKGVQLVGVYDVKPQAARDIAVQEDGCRTFLDPVHLMQSCDGVIIASPSESHADYVKRALAVSKPCLVEKPLASTLAEAERLLECAESSTDFVMVGHVERFNSTYQTFAKIVATEKPFAYSAERLSHWSPRGQDVSVVLDLMIHDLDLLLSLTGTMPDRVGAVGVTAKSPTMDYVSATLQWADGTTATLSASKASQYKVRRLTATGMNAMVEADLLRRSVNVHRLHVSNAYEYVGVRQEGTETQVLVAQTEPLRAELEEFADAIRESRPPKVTAKQGYDALALALEIERQALRP